MYVYTTINCVDFWFRCMLTLSFLDGSIYYITRQGRASGPLRGKGLRKRDNQWLICELIILTPSCSAFVCMHLDQKSIWLIVCKPSSIGSNFFQLLISKVWNLNGLHNTDCNIMHVYLLSVYSLMLVCKQ